MTEKKESDFLRRAFSCALVRGFYSSDKPLIDLPVQGSKQECKRMTSLVNRIAKYSPFGRGVLENAAKNGYNLSFEMQPLSAGYCDPEGKRIVLNPMLSDDALIPTLVHECRHADQNEQNKEAVKEYGTCNLKTEIMLFRAMEADAQSCAAMAALEIRSNTNEDAVWDCFAKKCPDIVKSLPDSVTAYQVNYPPFAVSNDLMQRAFNGWYDNASMVKQYEAGQIVNVMEYAKETKTDLAYSKDLSSEKIVKMFCLAKDGSCYWADRPDVLEDSKKIALEQRTADIADRFFADRQQRTGEKPDESYRLLPRRKNDGMMYVNGCCVGTYRDWLPGVKTKNSVQKTTLNVLRSKRLTER